MGIAIHNILYGELGQADREDRVRFGGVEDCGGGRGVGVVLSPSRRCGVIEEVNQWEVGAAARRTVGGRERPCWYFCPVTSC